MQSPSQPVTKSNTAFSFRRLFYDTVSISYVASNGKDLKGNGDSPIAVLFQNFLGWTEESYEIRYSSMANVLVEISTQQLTNTAGPNNSSV